MRNLGLLAAKLAQKQRKPLDRTQEWALALAERTCHNKAAVALANKTVRRLWAADRHGQAFDPNHLSTHSAPCTRSPQSHPITTSRAAPPQPDACATVPEAAKPITLLVLVAV